MSIGANMFDSLIPPAVWVTLHDLERPEADERAVTVRLKEAGRRSVSASMMVSKYSPEDSIFRAVSHLMSVLTAAQKRVTRELLVTEFERAIRSHVEPF